MLLKQFKEMQKMMNPIFSRAKAGGRPKKGKKGKGGRAMRPSLPMGLDMKALAQMNQPEKNN